MKPKFDASICNPNRLRVMITLLQAKDGSCGFTEIRDKLEMSDGNLASHIRALKSHDLIETQKMFRGSYPHTRVKITEKGLAELLKYGKWLVEYVLDAIPT